MFDDVVSPFFVVPSLLPSFRAKEDLLGKWSSPILIPIFFLRIDSLDSLPVGKQLEDDNLRNEATTI
jgi:hypothetical protein